MIECLISKLIFHSRFWRSNPRVHSKVMCLYSSCGDIIVQINVDAPTLKQRASDNRITVLRRFGSGHILRCVDISTERCSGEMDNFAILTF